MRLYCTWCSRSTPPKKKALSRFAFGKDSGSHGCGATWDWCRYLNALRWGYRRVGGDYLDARGGAGHPWRFRPRGLCTWYLWVKSRLNHKGAQQNAQWWPEDHASCFPWTLSNKLVYLWRMDPAWQRNQWDTATRWPKKTQSYSSCF